MYSVYEKYQSLILPGGQFSILSGPAGAPVLNPVSVCLRNPPVRACVAEPLTDRSILSPSLDIGCSITGRLGKPLGDPVGIAAEQDL